MIEKLFDNIISAAAEAAPRARRLELGRAKDEVIDARRAGLIGRAAADELIGFTRRLIGAAEDELVKAGDWVY